ncbi:MAG: LytR/AlgR family response regulator transcription factor [Flavobacteriales bacterium]
MTEKFRCLIVDDESAAHYVLTSYIERIERLELAGQCYNVLEAINFLHQNPVDLLFLDINMPELSGFDLLKTLTNPPKVIITTAYSEFALESYEYWVIDYLLKPIEFPRFLKSIDRFLITLPADTDPEAFPAAQPDPDLPFMVKVDGEQVRIHPDELLYAQSLGNYVKLITTRQTFLATITTTELEHRLPSARFMRIHKSYIVALDKVTRSGNGFVIVGETELPVGITYRRELAERLR